MGQRIIRVVLLLAGNAIGLLVAALVLSRMSLNGLGFLLAVVIFTIAAVVIRPLIAKVARENAPALEGGSALVTTFIALVVTDLFSDGLSISGIGTWLLATVIVWLGSLLAGVVLPAIFLKNQADERRK